MTPQERAAQDARDKIAEDTLLLLAMLAGKANLGNTAPAIRASDRVADLRHFTNRDASDGNRK